MSSRSATTRTNDVPFSQARHSVSIGALKTRQQHMAMRQNALTCFVVCGKRYANDFMSSPVTNQLNARGKWFLIPGTLGDATMNWRNNEIDAILSRLASSTIGDSLCLCTISRSNQSEGCSSHE